MSKLPKKKNGTSPAEFQFLKNIKEILIPVDQYTEIVASNTIRALKESLFENVQKAGRNARLSGYDEKIYTAYIQLIDYYQQIIIEYEKNMELLVSVRIKTITDGIYSVLKSRENHYEEQTVMEENPISTEKQRIMKTSIDFLAKACDNLENNLIEHRMRSTGVRMAVINDLYSDEIGLDFLLKDEFFINGIVKLHSGGMKFCLNSLNDVEARTVTKYYKELLEEEREILSSIIKIQVAALNSEKVCSPTEQFIVDKMIWSLQEAHQHLGKNADEISECFREADTSTPELLNKEQLSEYMSDKNWQAGIVGDLDYAELKNQVLPEIDSFKNDILKELNSQIEQETGITRTIYERQKIISNHIFMASEMIEVFRNMLDFSEYSLNNAAPHSNLEILKGISETMSIKIDSIKENQQMFLEECHQLTEKFKANRPQLNIEAIQLITAQTFEAFLGISTEDEKKGLANIKEILSNIRSSEVFTSYRSKVEKYINAYVDKSSSKIISFKRECLLFEVTTFEEIINYSVSRLQESDDDEILSFADCAYEGAVMLDIILKKNNIIPIKPAPHEPFNGKEHEVLMAEKNPDYKKGEIIKLVNSGYKQDGLIIIRANVIAAK